MLSIYGNGYRYTQQLATTNATPIVLAWATLATPGMAIQFSSMITGVQDNGQRAIYAYQIGHVSRNSTGLGVRVLTNVLNGYTSTTTLPWAALAVPAGWAATCVSVSGNTLRVSVTGAASTNIQWNVTIDATPIRGAVISSTL